MESKVQYEKLCDRELKQYLLNHRQDTAAFHAYMDRMYTRPSQIIGFPDDSDFENKLLASIQEQLEEG